MKKSLLKENQKPVVRKLVDLDYLFDLRSVLFNGCLYTQLQGHLIDRTGNAVPFKFHNDRISLNSNQGNVSAIIYKKGTYFI